MKKWLHIIIAIFLFSCSDETSIVDIGNIASTTFLGELEYVKTYGGAAEDTARAIVATNDGGYAILGFSNSIDGDLKTKTTSV